METFRTASNNLTERLDVDYYRPIYISNQIKLDALKTIRFQELYVKSGIGHTAGVEHHYSTNEVGIPFISGKVIKDSQLVLESAKNILAESHFGEMLKSRINSGYILIVRKGDVGNACIVPATSGEMNCSSEIMFFKCSNLTESYYLSAFFNAFHGELIIKRLQRGSLIPGVSLYDIPDLTIAYPPEKVRIYIGDKVRQAERWRDRSRELMEKVNLFHSRFIPSQIDIKFNRKSCRVSATELTERLDAHFYPAEVKEYQSSLNTATYPIGYLSIDTFNGQTRSYANNRFGISQATVANLSHSFLNGPYRQVETSKTSCRYLQKHDLLICNSAHQKNYIGRDVTYFQGGVKVSPSTEVMAIRTDREKIPASYLRSYLLTKIGYLQIQSTIRGISAHSYPQDVKLIQIPIPEMSDRDREIWFKCDEDMLLAGKCHDYAELLTTAAKLLVEALIEGKLSEADLKAAQEGLEKGDTTLDREILSRLTRKGIDNPNEPPLFPDLDALYAALASLDETTEAVAPSTSQTAKIYHLPTPYLALASEDRATYQVAAEVPE
jgi:type I restriction enzyme, S subunit